MRTNSLPGWVLVFLVGLVLSLTGCNTEQSTNTVNLGSVSIGTQLIDLKKARDAGALSGSEYKQLKNDLLKLIANASANTTDNAPEENVSADPVSDEKKTDTETEAEDDDSGFLF